MRLGIWCGGRWLRVYGKWKPGRAVGIPVVFFNRNGVATKKDPHNKVYTPED